MIVAALSILLTRNHLLEGHSPTPRITALPFESSEVTLGPGILRDAMLTDAKYLLEIDPYRLLHFFYIHSNLPTRGAPYGGWESTYIPSHTLGHYLSACAQMYAATSDKRFLTRVNSIITELSRCQDARPDHFVTGIPQVDRLFAEIAARNIRSQGFDLNGVGVPWYTLHKLFAGLIDAHDFAHNRKAIEVASKLADWAIHITQNLTDADWQKMLACEHGGMNEALANLAAITGQARYMTLAKKFYHRAILDPLSQQKPELAGKHANTNIPKVIGAARIYELTGEPKFATIARYFWEQVIDDHTYVTGGNSMGEHFGPPKKLNDRLSENTTETCNTYNMLKLTEHLFEWQPSVRLGDYYERALFNHILGTQNRTDGMMCYFTPLVSGAKKPFGSPFDDFTCCYGSGMENHAKYNQAIYFHSANDLWINLYIPSELNWKQRGSRLSATTSFPESGHISYAWHGANPGTLSLHFRYPSWARNAQLFVNGAFIPVDSQPGQFIDLTRKWVSGDKIELNFQMYVRKETMPDNPRRVALLYGPTLLAGILPNKDPKAPVILNDSPTSTWLRHTRPTELTFESVGFKPTNLELVPFYSIQDERYAVYFDQFTPEQWTAREAEYRRDELARKALEAATVDYFAIGEMQPERDHELKSERSGAGEYNGRKYRDAPDGWFEWRMKVDPSKDNELRLTYWGSDNNREFSILIDGVQFTKQALTHSHPDKFFEQPYHLSKEFLAGRSSVVIRLQALPGSTAGGLFGARVVRLP